MLTVYLIIKINHSFLLNFLGNNLYSSSSTPILARFGSCQLFLVSPKLKSLLKGQRFDKFVSLLNKTKNRYNSNLTYVKITNNINFWYYICHRLFVENFMSIKIPTKQILELHTLLNAGNDPFYGFSKLYGLPKSTYDP